VSSAVESVVSGECIEVQQHPLLLTTRVEQGLGLMGLASVNPIHRLAREERCMLRYTIAGGALQCCGEPCHGSMLCCVMLLWSALQVGIELKFKDAGYSHMAAVSHVAELAKVNLVEWQRLEQQCPRCRC
jgi:hypothetical protein